MNCLYYLKIIHYSFVNNFVNYSFTLQSSKLGLGKNRSIISYFSKHQVIQFNYYPLVLTFIAQAGANTGKLWTVPLPHTGTIVGETLCMFVDHVQTAQFGLHIYGVY